MKKSFGRIAAVTAFVASTLLAAVPAQAARQLWVCVCSDTVCVCVQVE